MKLVRFSPMCSISQAVAFSAGVLLFCAAMPSTARAQQANVAKKSAKSALEKRWKKLSKKQATEITRRHIHGLVRAAHSYHAAHGTLPPAVVPNPKLPAGKRLSGLVLLLPHIGAKSYLEKGKPCFDKDTIKLAAALSKSIDLTKAWDDPANRRAARTMFPAFLAPQSGPVRDKDGYGVTHFAFVQGGAKGRDGAFPGNRGVRITGITDGTCNTLAFGQIQNDLGPWIAEGLSTARQVFAPTRKNPGTFGSRYHKTGCYFATCDSAPFFIVFDKQSTPVLQKLATRSGGDFPGEYKRIRNPFDR